MSGNLSEVFNFITSCVLELEYIMHIANMPGLHCIQIVDCILKWQTTPMSSEKELVMRRTEPLWSLSDILYTF